MERTLPRHAAEHATMPSPARETQWKLWLVFACSTLGSTYVHEVGHCIPAWANGYPAVPTPAKEYILAAVPDSVQRAIALGGVVGTVLAQCGGVWLYFISRTTRASAILAGTQIGPLFYVVRFLSEGRGHDGTEFQEAQAALGFNPGGHALDWLFLTVCIATAVAWLWRSGTRLGLPLLWRCLQGAVLGLILLVGLQATNNLIFDSFFARLSRATGQESPPKR